MELGCRAMTELGCRAMRPEFETGLDSRMNCEVGQGRVLRF